MGAGLRRFLAELLICRWWMTFVRHAAQEDIEQLFYNLAGVSGTSSSIQFPRLKSIGQVVVE